jgi:hypothetical protein
MNNETSIKAFFEPIWPLLNERQRRIAASSYAKQLGYGGISLVNRATGLSRVTITKGIHEFSEEPLEHGRMHKPGAGRPSLESLEPTLIDTLLSLVDENSKGDPEIPKLWTLKSTRNLSDELNMEELFKTSSMALRGSEAVSEANPRVLLIVDKPDKDHQKSSPRPPLPLSHRRILSPEPTGKALEPAQMGLTTTSL